MAGGTFANFLLLFMAPPLAAVALKLGPAEVAALIFFSLTAVVSLMGDTRMEIWKGTLAVSAGLFMATIGLDAMTTTRTVLGLAAALLAAALVASASANPFGIGTRIRLGDHGSYRRGSTSRHARVAPRVGCCCHSRTVADEVRRRR